MRITNKSSQERDNKEVDVSPFAIMAVQEGKKAQDIGLVLPVSLTVHVYPKGERRDEVKAFDLEATAEEMVIRSNNYRLERMYHSPVPPKVGDAVRFNALPQESQMGWEKFFAELREKGLKPISDVFEIQTLWFSADGQQYEAAMEIEAEDLSHARKIRDQLTVLFGFKIKENK